MPKFGRPYSRQRTQGICMKVSLLPTIDLNRKLVVAEFGGAASHYTGSS